MGLKARYQKALDEFVNRVLERFRNNIENIIVFGSVARGEAREDSDIDVIVITGNEDYKLRRSIISIAFDVFLDTGNNISVKVLSKDDFETHKNFSFLKKVVSEGVKVV
ncbi:MAG: nucleotidyltransferase domain-containing protein [Archaeoglobaceae archaeon]